MVDKFIFWLESIVEDDPLPDEIRTILFKVGFNGNYKTVELIGYENEVNLSSVPYRPLEAQFFNLHELSKMKNEKFEFNLKYLIEEAFTSTILKQQYKKRKIYILYNNNLNYLFNIK